MIKKMGKTTLLALISIIILIINQTWIGCDSNDVDGVGLGFGFEIAIGFVFETYSYKHNIYYKYFELKYL